MAIAAGNLTGAARAATMAAMAKKTIGDRVRERREASGLTQQQAARKAGVQQSAWARLEKGHIANPRIDSLKAVAKALGCEVSDLI